MSSVNSSYGDNTVVKAGQHGVLAAMEAGMKNMTANFRRRHEKMLEGRARLRSAGWLRGRIKGGSTLAGKKKDRRYSSDQFDVVSDIKGRTSATF